MEENQKDKVYELEVSGNGISGKLKLQNTNSRVLATLGDIALDALNYFRWSNAVRFFDKYEDKKRKRNLEGKETPLAPKFLIEILSNAFIEDDEKLQDLWSNLLINWQDPDKRFDKKMMYIEILKNLSPTEVKILDLLGKGPEADKIRRNREMYIDGNAIKKLLNINEEEYELSMLNLFRMKCCAGFQGSATAASIGGIPLRADGGIEKFRVTLLGYNLIDSCLK
jgi:hypothetical protein